MRRLVLPLVLALSAALAYGVHGERRGDDGRGGSALPEARALRADLEVTVRTLGELQAVRSTTISSSIPGDRGKIVWLIGDGTKVREGDVLVKLDPTPFEEEVNKLKVRLQELSALVEVREQTLEWEKVQAEREVEASGFEIRLAEMEEEKLTRGEGPLELARLETEVSQALRELEESEGYLQDLTELAVKGYANEMEIHLASQRLEEKRAIHDSLRRRLESYRDYVLPVQKKKAGMEVERARIERGQVEKGAVFKLAKAVADHREALEKLENTKVRLEAARRELEAAVIRAPIPGMAVLQEEFRNSEKRKPRVGDTVWPNQALITLPDTSRMQVLGRIREIDLHKVSPGMAADVEVEAYPGVVLSGTVDSIGVLAQKDEEKKSGEKYFQVLITVDDADDRLRPGMTAMAEILSRSVGDALTVPVQAVFREGGSHYCYLAGPTGYRRRPVRVGAFNETTAEILEGLESGDRVSLVRPPDGLFSGVDPPPNRP